MSSGEIEVVRNARSRRAKLSVDPASGRVRLTLPPRAPLKAALHWAQEQQAWIDRQRARLPRARPFAPGAAVPFDDVMLSIVWDGAAPRRIVRDGEELRCGGPSEGLARRIETWLKREALRVLSAETAEFAAKADVTVAQVSIGDPKGRWGSCSASGVIRYSWRLILAPAFVRRSTVAHEIAHRVHMNHGPDFHALADALTEGHPEDSRAWLRANGAALHWFGRDS
ncbi:metal-dependent hydrolase [Sphingomonas sp. Leaf357]|uniref:M48 family metallopeptidase n=1 Tax=Sphingomonas sp. Leaf357 TaxID=1736350 RepID=UPI0006FD6379|nr:SprT family zinc-dependent metalloprotease [Sphingomonas sp. Leaf357]KQS03224.1 metal-dependent hydrolase [Sphingomonas sp. Leaf357]